MNQRIIPKSEEVHAFYCFTTLSHNKLKYQMDNGFAELPSLLVALSNLDYKSKKLKLEVTNVGIKKWYLLLSNYESIYRCLLFFFFCLEENLVLNYWKIKTVVQNI